MSSLDGKVALVTGGGRGIGKAVAQLLAIEGATVVVNDLGVSLSGEREDLFPGKLVVESIVSSGGKAVADFTDITDHEAVGDLVDRCVADFGSLDIVVNVAGILRDRMIFNMEPPQWDDVLSVHLDGHFNTAKHASRYWRSRREPDGNFRLINFTSGSGLHGAPGQPNYAAAKMGVVGLTFSCANALAPYGVTVNAIAPAANTRMTASTPGDRRSTAWEADAEWEPRNVVPIVAYLASAASSWCTGRIFSARGYDVVLYSNPEPLVRLRSEGGWELEDLGRQVEKQIRPVVAAHPLRSPVEQREHELRVLGWTSGAERHASVKSSR